MYSRPKVGLAAYNRVASLETDRLKQIVLLYEGAIKFLQLAAVDIENKNLNAKAEHSNRALDIINYLQSILDFERGGEVASTLDTFYRSISKLVLQASSTLDAQTMRRAADLMVPVSQAWLTNANNQKEIVTADLAINNRR
jgi:flagellar protein FliS